MAGIRLAVVADIHHGKDVFTKRGTAALPLLKRFIAEVNDGDFDAVIDLGDRISDENADRDKELQAEVALEFGALEIGRHHVNGNHDRATLTQAGIDGILGAPTESRTVYIGDVRLVFWQPNVDIVEGRELRLEPGDIDELSRLLGSDDRPTLLVTHVPLSGHIQTGNYYFEHNPGQATYAEVNEIRCVIGQAPCPIVGLAGHVHWNTLTVVDGTPHITLQSLTETFTTGGPAGAAAVLEIEDRVLRWTVRGQDPISLVLPWPAAKRLWKAPLLPTGSNRDHEAEV
jgi:3',5'-cyclic-AMP phosphodiesterase